MEMSCTKCGKYWRDIRVTETSKIDVKDTEYKPIETAGRIQGLGAQIYSIELRDLFAMETMKALIQKHEPFHKDTCDWAYEIANEMLRARNRISPDESLKQHCQCHGCLRFYANPQVEVGAKASDFEENIKDELRKRDVSEIQCP